MLTLTCVSMRKGEGERHVEDNMAHVAMELERESERCIAYEHAACTRGS